MIRAPLGDSSYWNKWVDVQAKNIARKEANLLVPAANPDYEPEYILSLAQALTEHLIQRYSRGDAVSELGEYLPQIVDAWEKSNQSANAVCEAGGISSCRDWEFSVSDFRHYNWTMWLVSFGLTLSVDDQTWQRLLALVGAEGEDVLLDRLIASRSPDRRIGATLCHKKPYGRLLAAIEAAPADRPALLLDFVSNWYPELKRTGQQRLWWYDWCDVEKTPLEMGNYFGCWCFEAAAAAKVFGIDDHLCLGQPQYPGDIIRPDGPSTHQSTQPLAPAQAPSILGKALGLFGRGTKR